MKPQKSVARSPIKQSGPFSFPYQSQQQPVMGVGDLIYAFSSECVTHVQQVKYRHFSVDALDILQPLGLLYDIL